jgi:NTP pyrophosphatase (non-canonical NTP hydrolase)
MTVYEDYADAFVKKNGLSKDHIDVQFRCIVEELGEFAKALSEGDRYDQAHELVDLLFTIFVMARLLNVNVLTCYIKKSEINLTKTNKTSTGKIKM